MKTVHFRTVTAQNWRDCLALQLSQAQQPMVANNAASLAEAYINPTLLPYGVYDNATLGFEQPITPMVGFVMLEVTAGVGFILRLMIDQNHQAQGYARAAVREAVRRLRLTPDVQLIATSHRRENTAVGQLFASEGFAPWDIEYAHNHPTEVYLCLR
jgi:diamine N-acetyltransferase